jgi:hypothetical protein
MSIVPDIHNSTRRRPRSLLNLIARFSQQQYNYFDYVYTIEYKGELALDPLLS